MYWLSFHSNPIIFLGILSYSFFIYMIYHIVNQSIRTILPPKFFHSHYPHSLMLQYTHIFFTFIIFNGYIFYQETEQII